MTDVTYTIIDEMESIFDGVARRARQAGRQPQDGPVELDRRRAGDHVGRARRGAGHHLLPGLERAVPHGYRRQQHGQVRARRGWSPARRRPRPPRRRRPRPLRTAATPMRATTARARRGRPWSRPSYSRTTWPTRTSCRTSRCRSARASQYCTSRCRCTPTRTAAVALGDARARRLGARCGTRGWRERYDDSAAMSPRLMPWSALGRVAVVRGDAGGRAGRRRVHLRRLRRR